MGFGQTSRRLLPPALALAGLVTLALCAPRFNNGARIGYTLDRAEAVARTRAEAARFGFNTSGWPARVTADYNGQTSFYLSKHPRTAETRLLSPVTTTVMLVEPSQKRLSFQADLTNDGQVSAYEIRGPAGGGASADAPAEESRRAAQAALESLVGAGDAPAFAFVSEVRDESKATTYTWERSLAQDDDLKLRVTARAEGGAVRRVELVPSFAPRFQDEYVRRAGGYKFVDLAGFLFVILTILATLTFCLFGFARREFDFRTALTLFAVVYVLSLLLRLCDGSIDQILMSRNGQGAQQGVTTIALVLNALAVPFFYALGLVLVWGAGRIYARRARTPDLATLDALLRGRLLSRAVGASIATGLLFGLFLCALPYALAATGLLGSPRLEGPLSGSLISRAPAVVALLRPVDYGLFAVYAFFVPVTLHFARSPRAARAVGLLLGGLWVLNEDIYRSTAWGALLVAALVILAVDQIVRRYDLLTLVVALLCAEATRAAWSLVVLPSPSLRASGLRALAALGLFLCAALVLGWRGREAREAAEEEAADSALEAAERDRLRAEFNVAREAQQRMLPGRPPSVTGYEISAMCRPAREVGGDLYDFLSLPDERVGFVVADVSGKGVPAALYMTLTKGLLASVAETESDPAAILREVNRHLYEVCRRKVFVTMILGVLDAPTRTVTYARAGHNPGLWHNARRRTATWLRANGLGLGLNRGTIFDKSLQLDTVRVESGDSLVFYSDGVTEAMNAAGEEYGEERLRAAVARADGLGAEQTQNAILEDVTQFLDGVAPQDDMTIVVLRVREE